MARYYATIASLPNIGVDDRKLPIRLEALRQELNDVLTPQDRRLLDLLILEGDLPQLLKILHSWHEVEDLDWEEATPEDLPSIETPLESLPLEELATYYIAVRAGVSRPRAPHLPLFIKNYIDNCYPDSENIEEQEELRQERIEEQEMAEYPYLPEQLRLEEDRLVALYYEFLLKHRNKFVSEWAKLNLNIRNMLAAYTSRQLHLDPKEYIIGSGEIQHQLRTSQASDFGITPDQLPQLPQIINISNEQDIARREQMIDRIRWEWLEDQVFFKPFDIEYLLSYYLQLGILERWVSLNEETGEEIFRQIVAKLKHESTSSLEEFKRKQKK